MNSIFVMKNQNIWTNSPPPGAGAGVPPKLKPPAAGAAVLVDGAPKLNAMVVVCCFWVALAFIIFYLSRFQQW